MDTVILLEGGIPAHSFKFGETWDHDLINIKSIFPLLHIYPMLPKDTSGIFVRASP